MENGGMLPRYTFIYVKLVLFPKRVQSFSTVDDLVFAQIAQSHR